tara:strand:- start:14596 stop:15279 length:684 start_codon:yes stop_codon:yes gene_type:complete
MEGNQTIEYSENYVYMPEFWPTKRNNYQRLIDEIGKHLIQSNVKLFGAVHQERRLTCLMAEKEMKMSYSGRTVVSNKIENGTLLSKMLNILRSEKYQSLLCDIAPELKDVIPKFNAVFINHYRRREDWGDKPDGLGFHSDDEKDLKSSVILAVTFCEDGGERIFRFQDKKTKTILWQKELENGSALWMLPGCQDRTKHEISDRKTHIDGSKVTGGRISLTFRQLVLP